ncbi:MAG: RNA methyltransferase [Anaerolineae bacterium]|nr:RNA methyltransferase [Anaerolineae bacterium]
MDTIITSTRNPRIVAARKLDQRKHRQEQGRFAVEGLQLLGMALDGGCLPHEVFYCEALFTGETAPALLQQFQRTPAELMAVSAEVLRALSERDTPQGLFATFHLPDTPLDALPLSVGGLVIVLDRLRDPGNLGTILRTADAAGASAVILLTPGVDLYDPRTVRASMGSLFNLPVIQTGDAQALFRRFADANWRVVGADAARGQYWTELDWRGSMALVLGNEAQGLSDDLQAGIHEWAALPIHGKADSLNVAVAGGILTYAWVAANHPA